MPSRFGFKTEEEVREARRVEKETAAELVRAQEARDSAAATATFERARAHLLGVLFDFVVAREITLPEYQEEPFSITITGNNVVDGIGYHVTIKIHIPLDDTNKIYILKPEDWESFYRMEDLHALGAVIAEQCGITTIVSKMYHKPFTDEGQLGDFRVIPAGEHAIAWFYPPHSRA